MSKGASKIPLLLWGVAAALAVTAALFWHSGASPLDIAAGTASLFAGCGAIRAKCLDAWSPRPGDDSFDAFMAELAEDAARRK